MRFLSNKEKKELNSKLPFGYQIDKKDEIKEHDGILYLNNEKILINIDGIYLPHIQTIPRNKFKSVFVDRGAIPFVIKGADVMRPGITKIDDDINKDDIIQVCDETHNKLLALGTAIFNTQEMRIQEKGKSVKIYNYHGDKYC